MSRYEPRLVRTSRERETTLPQYRVKRGFTVQALADAVGVQKSVLVDLASGMRSPLYIAGKRAGTIRKEVLELEMVLGVSASELFPAYICGIDARELPDDIAVELTAGGWSMAASSADMELFEEIVEMRKAVWEAVRCLTARQKRIVLRRVVTEESLLDISVREKLSVEAVRQIEKKALRRLHWRLSRPPKEIVTEPYVAYGESAAAPILPTLAKVEAQEVKKNRKKYTKRSVSEADYLLGLI